MSEKLKKEKQAIQRKRFFENVEREVERAREKFPSNDLLGYAFVEESGELTKAILDKRNSREGGHFMDIEIYKEAVQTVAMVIRLLEEGSHELDLGQNLYMDTE